MSDQNDPAPDPNSGTQAPTGPAGGGQPPAAKSNPLEVPMSPPPRTDVKYGDGKGGPANPGESVPMTLHAAD